MVIKSLVEHELNEVKQQPIIAINEYDYSLLHINSAHLGPSYTTTTPDK